MLAARNSLMAAAFLAVVVGFIPWASAQSGSSSPTAAARAQLQIAQASVDQIKNVALGKLASDPTWTAAGRAATDADDRLEAARVRARDAAHQSKEFADLKARLSTAATETQTLEIRVAMTALEATAIMDSADVKDAWAAKMEAAAVVSQLWNDYEAKVLAHDPKWVGAIAARDQARAALAAAEVSATHAAGAGRPSSAARSSSKRSSSRSRRSSY